MTRLEGVTLSQHLAREFKDPTTVEIITEMVTAWLRAQADKYIYFDDEDPCTCGGEAGESHRVEAGVLDLAGYVATDTCVPSHRSGECRTDDDEDDDDDEDEDD